MTFKNMSEMKPGDRGTIKKINGTGNIKHRLIDMGVVPGTEVQIIKYAPLGDPIEIKVKNFNLSLRKNEAATIDVDVM